ncbi:MAG: redoxin domain-containing protein [Candidatus Hydrogenedentes bacterium]|nr:redoxin domain-containing protein [Candidatus Hydrogenedentota bacterium]
MSFPEPPALGRIPRPSDTGLAVASLILGLVSIPTAPCLVGGILAIAGVVTGAVSLSKNAEGRPMAIIGCVLSVIGLLSTAAAVIVGFQFATKAFDEMGQIALKEDHAELVGVRAPQLELQTLEGESIALAGLKGKRVVIDVFRSGDPDCEEQVKSLNALFADVSPDQVVILGIAAKRQSDMEAFGDSRPKYKVAVLERLPWPFDETIWYPTTFFIDRNGVIDAVTVDNQPVETLRQLATAPDYTDAPAEVSPAVEVTLDPADGTLQFSQAWSIRFDNPQAMCVADWNADGFSDALIVDHDPALHVVDENGAEIAAVPLPEGFQTVTEIEAGVHKDHGLRLLGLSRWGNAVHVSDSSGNEVWKYKSMWGINGAHWGDLDGDGSDEMIVGMNGFSGLHAVSSEGKRLWTVRSIGNVWTQAVIGATASNPARVFATEAGGQVYVYDNRGNTIRAIRPRGHYYATMSATVVDSTERVQILAIGDELGNSGAKALAFNERGLVAWSTPIHTGRDAMRSQVFASGDADGDGEQDWILKSPGQGLIVVSSDGQAKGTLPFQGRLLGFGVLNGKENHALIVTLASDELTAYRVELTPESAAAEREGAE